MTDTPEVEVPKSKIKNQKSEIGVELPLPLTAMVEALLFVSSEPVPVQQIAEALNFKVDAIEQALIELRDGIEGVSRGLRLHRKGDKVQLTTHPECAPYIEKFLGLDLTSRLSKPALETLSIIAYQQPVTRAQIEQVRGVNCDGVLANLLNKGLIEEVGRLETAGRPIQYGTTFAFLQHFGLRGLDDMPQLQPIEAAALEAMSARPDEPIMLADAQMMETKMVDGRPKAADQPAAPPIRETQLALVADESDSSAPAESNSAADIESQFEADAGAAEVVVPDEATTAVEDSVPLEMDAVLTNEAGESEVGGAADDDGPPDSEEPAPFVDPL
jgi:segregation and condensation protein B